MSLNDLDAAQVCSDLYWHPETLDEIIEVDGVILGVRNYADATIVCFRGSTTPQDWFRDFRANMIADGQLGGVEAGFIIGIRAAMAKINALNPINPLWITGHSLGAARAVICAGLLEAEKLLIPADEVVVFGCPRPGGEQLKTILKDTSIRSYKNLYDPVCDVPFHIPGIAPYVHVRESIPVYVQPAEPDPWGIVADHHFELYLQAMKNAFPADSASS